MLLEQVQLLEGPNQAPVVTTVLLADLSRRYNVQDLFGQVQKIIMSFA